jgi:hypothetical protein
MTVMTFDQFMQLIEICAVGVYACFYGLSQAVLFTYGGVPFSVLDMFIGITGLSMLMEFIDWIRDPDKRTRKK